MLAESYREDFPILKRRINDQPLIYLDSSATTLKPRAVIEAVTGFYEGYTANVHRAVHTLSEEATNGYEGAREKVARFLNADSREIAFVKNATEALNVVAASMSGKVAFAPTEHHSNLLPWRAGNHVLLPTSPTGRIDAAAAAKLIAEERPQLIAVSVISNALGIRQPIEALTRAAREAGSLILLDLSQAVGHIPVDVLQLDCDFACFSGHKMLGPSGIGVLYRREGSPVVINPLFVGGEMVHEVHVDSFEARPWPWCLEAGTPNIEGAIGLGAACDYLEEVGVDAIETHCETLTERLLDRFAALPNISLVTVHDASRATSIVSFYTDKMPSHGLARILSNRFSMMLRSGYHCAQPWHESMSLPETTRASFHLYNTVAEVDALVDAVSIATAA